jgi:hypothetical protein
MITHCVRNRLCKEFREKKYIINYQERWTSAWFLFCLIDDQSKHVHHLFWHVLASNLRIEWEQCCVLAFQIGNSHPWFCLATSQMDWYIVISLCDACIEVIEGSQISKRSRTSQLLRKRMSSEARNTQEKTRIVFFGKRKPMVSEFPFWGFPFNHSIELCSRFMLRFVVKIGVHLPIKLLAKPRRGLVSDHHITTAGSRARTSRLSPYCDFCT